MAELISKDDGTDTKEATSTAEAAAKKRKFSESKVDNTASASGTVISETTSSTALEATTAATTATASSSTATEKQTADTNTDNQPELDQTWARHLSSDFVIISDSLAANPKCLMLQMKHGGVQCIPYTIIEKLHVDEEGTLHGRCNTKFNNEGWTKFNLGFTNTTHANVALAKLASFLHSK